MVTLRVKVVFNDEVLGTASGNPDLHSEYIASKSPNPVTIEEEVAAVGTEEVFEKSMTVFPKDANGNPIAWDYQWKGFLKDAFGMLKRIPGTECSKIKAYKKEIDGLIFVYPRKIPFKVNGKMGICQRPLRASTAQGERIALASSESIPEGSSITFEIRCLIDSDEKAVIEALDYGEMRGFSQWRNSGKGRFSYNILERTVTKK